MFKKHFSKATGIAMILLLFQFSVFAIRNRDSKDLIFKDGDRVAFIGNSITHGGLYHLYIQTYYQTRFPDRNIDFYDPLNDLNINQQLLGIKAGQANGIMQILLLLNSLASGRF
jgi:hypothetical protein